MKYLRFISIGLLGFLFLVEAPLGAEESSGEKESTLIARPTRGKDCKGCHAKRKNKGSYQSQETVEASCPHCPRKAC